MTTTIENQNQAMRAALQAIEGVTTLDQAKLVAAQTLAYIRRPEPERLCLVCRRPIGAGNESQFCSGTCREIYGQWDRAIEARAEGGAG